MNSAYNTLKQKYKEFKNNDFITRKLNKVNDILVPYFYDYYIFHIICIIFIYYFCSQIY
jgi:hypothetical protein